MAIGQVITPVVSDAWDDGSVARTVSCALSSGNGNHCLVVHVMGANKDGINDDVTSVVWKAAGGDQSLTEITETKWSNDGYCSSWQLVNPDIETANIEITFDQTPVTPFDEGVMAVVQLWENVNQTTPFTGTPTTEATQDADSSVARTDAVDTDLVIDALNVEVLVGSETMGADQTLRGQGDTGSATPSYSGHSSSQLGSVTGDVMSWSFASNHHAHHALRMQNDDAAAGVTRTVPQADLALDTKTPTQSATAHVTRAAPQTDLAIDEKTPTATIAWLRTTPQTDLVIDPKTPTQSATTNHFRTTPQTDLVLDGKTPTTTVTLNHFRDPPQTDLVIDLKLPSVQVGGNISKDPPQADLTIDTKTPATLENIIRLIGQSDLVIDLKTPEVLLSSLGEKRRVEQRAGGRRPRPERWLADDEEVFLILALDD